MSRKELRMEWENEALVSQFRKRTELLLAFFTALVLLFLMRLFYVQIDCHESFERAVKSQYEIPVSGFDTEYNFYYIIEKSREDRELKELLADGGAKDITKESSRYSVYEMKTHNSVLNRKLRQDYGAYAFRNYTALRQRHNAAKGKKFVIIVYADAAGKIIPGISPEIREQS